MQHSSSTNGVVSSLNGHTTSTPATPSVPVVQPCEHPEHLALAAAWYPDEAGDAELCGYGADAIGQFADREGRMPRCAEELDAWSNAEEEYAAYLAANPVPAAVATEQAAAPSADAVKQAAEQAAEEADAKEQAAREEAVATLQACVKAYRKGERALLASRLESGRLAELYIRQRVALSPKERPAAVQQLCSSLGMWSSEVVDRQYVNRLVACWQAYNLLALEQGLDKASANVPWGHFRDAWCQLVQDVAGPDGQETAVLLVGVEDMARDHYKRAVADGLSLASCKEWVQVVKRENLQQQAIAKATAEVAAKAEREAKEREAAEALKVTRAAAAAKQRAADDAEQAATDAAAAQAEAEAKPEDPAVLAAAEAAQAEAARKQEAARVAAAAAAQKAKDEEAARAALVLKQQQEHRAKEESRVADQKQTEAEAKRVAAERKAAEKAATKGTKPAPQPAGTNLIPTQGTPKDVAEFLATTLLKQADPDQVFALLLGHLMDAKTDGPQAAFKSDAVQDAIIAAVWSLQDSADKAEAAAKAKLTTPTTPAPTVAAEPALVAAAG